MRIDRYALPGGAEQTQAGSGGRVLRNKADIRRKQDMDQAEYEVLPSAQERCQERVVWAFPTAFLRVFTAYQRWTDFFRRWKWLEKPWKQGREA